MFSTPGAELSVVRIVEGCVVAADRKMCVMLGKRVRRKHTKCWKWKMFMSEIFSTSLSLSFCRIFYARSANCVTWSCDVLCFCAMFMSSGASTSYNSLFTFSMNYSLTSDGRECALSRQHDSFISGGEFSIFTLSRREYHTAQHIEHAGAALEGYFFPHFFLFSPFDCRWLSSCLVPVAFCWWKTVYCCLSPLLCCTRTTSGRLLGCEKVVKSNSIKGN